MTYLSALASRRNRGEAQTSDPSASQSQIQGKINVAPGVKIQHHLSYCHWWEWNWGLVCWLSFTWFHYADWFQTKLQEVSFQSWQRQQAKARTLTLLDFLQVAFLHFWFMISVGLLVLVLVGHGCSCNTAQSALKKTKQFHQLNWKQYFQGPTWNGSWVHQTTSPPHPAEPFRCNPPFTWSPSETLQCISWSRPWVSLLQLLQSQYLLLQLHLLTFFVSSSLGWCFLKQCFLWCDLSRNCFDHIFILSTIYNSKLYKLECTLYLLHVRWCVFVRGWPKEINALYQDVHNY